MNDKKSKGKRRREHDDIVKRINRDMGFVDNLAESRRFAMSKILKAIGIDQAIADDRKIR